MAYQKRLCLETLSGSLLLDLRNFVAVLISPSYTFRLILMVWESKLLSVKRQLFVSQGEETMEKILNPFHFRCLLMPGVGVHILEHHRKNPRFWYATLTFKPKTDPTEIYLEACYFPLLWNPEIRGPNTIIDLCYGSFRSPQKIFKVDPTPEGVE
ncbi:hypothetical protein ACTXT7_002584 [Hymenolepis weldensis]